LKPVTRLALLLSLVLGVLLGIPALALADHEQVHNHDFCGQGGASVTGGMGGTDVDDVPSFIAARRHFGDSQVADPADRPILVPEHLAVRFTDESLEDPDGDGFVEVGAPLEVAAVGSNASQFHGGHGGGPQGGQGGATLLAAAGDGGCKSELVAKPLKPGQPGVPGRRLPITGPTTQFLLMGGVFMILGASFVFAPHIISWMYRRGGSAAEAAMASMPDGESVRIARSGQVVPRLRDEVGLAWSRAT
jgi:hypothetical protein